MNIARKLIMLAVWLGTTYQPSSSWADAGWELTREREGIRVFTREVAGSSHKAVRSEMVIGSTLNAAVGLIRDTDACPEWAEMCKSSYEHEVVTERELYVYTYNDIPWPVKDRDALTHVIWEQDPRSYTVSMVATATTDILPEDPHAVRLVNAVTSWELTPLPDGQLQVVSKAHIDPNGPTPAWITNLLLVDTPYQTMVNMRKVLATGRYDEVRFEFIRVPGVGGD